MSCPGRPTCTLHTTRLSTLCVIVTFLSRSGLVCSASRARELRSMLRPPLRLLYFTVRAPPRSATAQSPRLREHPVFTRTPLNWGPRAAAAGIRLRECARKLQNERLPLANNSHTPDATFDSLLKTTTEAKNCQPSGRTICGGARGAPTWPRFKTVRRSLYVPWLSPPLGARHGEGLLRVHTQEVALGVPAVSTG